MKGASSQNNNLAIIHFFNSRTNSCNRLANLFFFARAELEKRLHIDN